MLHQWTSFSEPGKFPLVLDPVVQGSKLTRVLIDGGSGLNLIFASTLVKMGLNYMSLLTPSKGSFLRHHPRKFFYSNWLGHSPSHIWYRTKFPDRLHQIRSSRLRIFLPCQPGKTSASQVHGSTTLRVPAPQDAMQHRSTFLTRRPPQVLRMRQASNRSCCHNMSP